METSSICKQCGKHFKYRKHLLEHERRHDGQTPYRCCGKYFNSVSHLTRHRCSIHGDVKAYVCVTCGKSFALLSDLKRHERREKRELKMSCDICGHKCDDMTNLTDHMSKHSDQRPHKCQQCPASYKYRSGLSRHMKNKHA